MSGFDAGDAAGWRRVTTHLTDRRLMRLPNFIAGTIALGLALSVASTTADARPPADKGEPHWAFVPVARPELPPTSDPAWARNPIDRFVLARMEAEGVKPVGLADQRTLLRRLYLDLIGLPPTVNEVRRFLNDRSPEAVARVVDDLLARPQYGERWRDTGSTWCDTPNLTAMSATAPSPTPGDTATTSSML